MIDYLHYHWDFNSDKLAEVYDELPFWSAPFGIQLLEKINYKKGISVLDIGFGCGFPLTEIAMRFGEQSKIFGLDPWRAGVERAKKKIEFYGINNIQILQAYAESIPLSDKSIDLIISNNGLNNVTDLNKSLAECARICKPDGQFVISINLPGTMAGFYEILEKVLTNLKLIKLVEVMYKHINDKRMPLEHYISLFEKFNFYVNPVFLDSFTYTFIDANCLFRHFFIQIYFLAARKELLPPDRIVEIFKMLEHEINIIAEKEGNFSLNIPYAIIDCKKLG